MAEKILNTRIALKIDTLENWSNSTLPLKKGELALATVAASAGTGLAEPVVMIKVGEDGVKTFKDLEWNVYAKASDVLAACKTEAALKTFVNGVITDAGVATDEALSTLSTQVTTNKSDISALKTTVGDAESGLVKSVATLEGLVGDTEVATQISNTIAALDLANTYDAKGAAADALADAKEYADGLNTAIDTRVDALEADTHTHANKEELDKIAVGDKAKWDAMEQNAKDYADAEDAKIESRVEALEAKFTGDDSVADQIADAVAAEAAIARAAEKANADAIDAIEADYLKTADKTELQGNIDDLQTNLSESIAAEAERATKKENEIVDSVTAETNARVAADEALDARLVEVETFFKTAEGETLDTALDTLVEIQKYLDGEGSAADQMVLDIAANTKAIEDEATARANVDTVLSGRLDTLEAINHEAYVTADTALKNELNTEIAKKANQTDLEAAVTRIGTAEGAIDALEALVGDTKVATQIANAIDEALKIDGVDKYALASALTAAIEQHNTDKAALEAAIALKANDADLAAIAKTGNVNDLVQTDGDVLIFDCGSSV